MINEDEETIRDYLLHKDKRLAIAKHRALILREFKDIWMIGVDVSYLMIHLDFDKYFIKFIISQTLLRSFEPEGEGTLQD